MLKTWGPVGLLLIVFLVMYLLGQSVSGGGDDPLGQAGNDLTPAPTSAATPGTAATPAGDGTAVPAEWQSLEPYDLQADERRGGHTIARHVDRTDAQLAQRLKDEPGISAASTYASLALAELSVAATLEENEDRLTDWEQRTGDRANLVLRYEAPMVVGRTHDRDETAPTNSEDVVVVLRWTGSDWFVLTSYPEDR